MNTEEEAAAFIEEMKKKYWDARHNCSAYVIGKDGEYTRCNDDGEPPQTAGLPMLEVLLHAEVRNIVVVVTRYFGGTLLGTGGLIRAYGQTVKEALANSVIAEEVKGVMLTSVSTDIITATMDALNRKALIITIIIIISLLALAILLANVLIRPFDRITNAIGEVKEGYTTDPISVPDYLETEHIVDAFNSLQSRMKILDDSRQEFVANVSHELKTPMTSVKVLADSLIAQQDAPAELYREFMVDIADEIERENKIINDLLALVKLDKAAAELNITGVNMNEQPEIILKRLRPIARKNDVELLLVSTREIIAEVDEVKMSLILTNLIENAIKYNKKHGKVTVTLDADHQYFTIEVSDTGIGIPEDSMTRIYERFYRVDKSHSREIGGTGLGLAITRNAVLLHRGTIKVESKEGEGTTFLVKIPLTYLAV